jgi:hypothetical protein
MLSRFDTWVSRSLSYRNDTENFDMRLAVTFAILGSSDGIAVNFTLRCKCEVPKFGESATSIRSSQDQSHCSDRHQISYLKKWAQRIDLHVILETDRVPMPNRRKFESARLQATAVGYSPAVMSRNTKEALLIEIVMIA